MQIGLGIGIPFIRNYISRAIQQFTPASLFANNEQGVWYDPSDINLAWRRNLLTYSEQFDNAAWVKAGTTITADATLAPNGALQADLLLETAVNSQHYALQTVATNASSATLSFYVKPAGRTKIRIRSENPQTGTLFNDFTLSGIGWVSNSSAGSITQAANGFYLCTVNSTSNGTGASGYHLIQTLDDSGNDAYAGDISKGIYIWGAQLEVGSTATPYQRITDGIKDYLDYKPLPVLYQDAAGTLPVTAVEQPVGLMLDKSKGLVLGPEQVYTSSISGLPAGGGTRFYPVNMQNMAAGKPYKITFTISNYSGTGYVGLAGAAPAGVTQLQYLGNGTFSCIQFPTGSGVINFFTLNANTADFSNISVRELPGNHAFNSSGNSANFPVLSARYNLATETEFRNGLTDAPIRSGLISASTLTGYLGAIAFGYDGATISYAYKGQTFTGSTAYKLSVDVQMTDGNAPLFQSSNSANEANDFILVVSGDVPNPLTYTTTSLGNGVYRVAVVFTTQASPPTINWGVIKYNTNSSRTFKVTAYDLRVANDALNQPTYQRVNTSSDYDTAGFKPYLKFNGVNQWLETNSIDFTATDKMFVCSGIRKKSDKLSFAQMFIELSNGATNRRVSIGQNTATDRIFFASGGDSIAAATSGTLFPAPVTVVVAGIGNISGKVARLEVNSGFSIESNASQGSGMYSNAPIYIGSRAGNTFFADANFYGIVVAGKQASADEITNTKTFINQKTGAWS